MLLLQFILFRREPVTLITPTQARVSKSSWKTNQGHVRRGPRQTSHPRDTSQTAGSAARLGSAPRPDSERTPLNALFISRKS